jgi:hypothetical protein
MNFVDFVRSIPAQEDQRLMAFVSFVKQDKNFPQTNDPAKLAIYLYLKLDHGMTTTFQNCLMLYSKIPNNKLPKRFFGRADMPLMAINLIVSLQNFDSDYPWP